MEKAIRRFTSTGDFERLGTLVAMLRDTNPEDADAFVEGLVAPEWRVRMHCLAGLSKARPSAELAQIVGRHLDDPEEMVREHAARALAAFGALGAAYAPRIGELFRHCVDNHGLYDAADYLDVLAAIGACDDETRDALLQLADRAVVEGLPYQKTADAVFSALPKLVPGREVVRDLCLRGLWSEHSQAAVSCLRAVSDDLGQLMEDLLATVDLAWDSPESGLWDDFRRTPEFHGTVVEALLFGRFEAWQDWAAVGRWLKGDGGALLVRLSGAQDEQQFASWLQEVMPGGDFDRDRLLARALAGAEFEPEVEDATTVKLFEVTIGGWMIFEVQNDEQRVYLLFEGADDYLTRDDGYSDAEIEANLGSLREQAVDWYFDAEVQLEVSDEADEATLETSDGSWSYADGVVEDDDGEENESTLEEFVARGLAQMRLHAAYWSADKYQILLAAAESDAQWDRLERDFEAMLDAARGGDERSGIAPSLGAATVAAGRGDLVRARQLADRVADYLVAGIGPDAEQDWLVGENHEWLAQLVEGTFAAYPDFALSIRVSSALAKSVDAANDSDGGGLSGEVLGQWRELLEHLSLYPDYVRTRTLRLVAEEASHPLLLTFVGCELYNLEDPTTAREVLERARDNLAGEPPLSLLNNLESVYLSLGLQDEADEVARERGLAFVREYGNDEPKSDAFDVNAAMERVMEVANESYRLLMELGTLVDYEPMVREGAELQLEVLAYWRPPDLSGNDFPRGRAACQAMANWVDLLIDAGRPDEGVAFWRRATADPLLNDAYFRDFPGPAESLFTVGMWAALATGDDDDLAYAAALKDRLDLKGFARTRPWSHYTFAAIEARRGRADEAFDHIDEALGMQGAPRDEILNKIAETTDFEPVHSDPRWAALWRRERPDAD